MRRMISVPLISKNAPKAAQLSESKRRKSVLVRQVSKLSLLTDMLNNGHLRSSLLTDFLQSFTGSAKLPLV